MMKESSVQLLKNFLSLVSVKGIDFLIPLVIFPFLVTVLGLDKFGLISFSLSACAYFGAFIQYGFSITAVRDIARVKNDISLLSDKFNNFFWATLFLLLVAFFVFSIVLFMVPIFRAEKLLYFTTFFLVGMQAIFPFWFFQGIEEMKLIAYINVLTKFLYLITLFFLVKGPNDYIYVYLLYGISVMIGNIIALVIIKRKFEIVLFAPSFNNVKTIVFEGRHAFITQFAPNMYNNTATFVLGFIVSNTSMGVYVSATKIIDALNSLGVLITSTFLPYLSRSTKNHNKFKWIMFTVGIGVCLLSYNFSSFIIGFFVDDKKIEVEQYFRGLIPMVLFIYIRLIYGPSFLMLKGKEKVYKNIVLYTCMFFFFFSFFIIPRKEIYGAIYIMLGASFVMAVLTYLAYLKNK